MRLDIEENQHSFSVAFINFCLEFDYKYKYICILSYITD